MKLFNTVFIFLFTSLTLPLKAGEEFCGVRNKAFLAGETITYKVYYTLAGAFVTGGEAVFNAAHESGVRINFWMQLGSETDRKIRRKMKSTIF